MCAPHCSLPLTVICCNEAEIIVFFGRAAVWDLHAAIKNECQIVLNFFTTWSGTILFSSVRENFVLLNQVAERSFN